ncbi:MAG TPA: hypothetical protein VGI39_04795 [Polyangiaceae bacterium]|jgi:hypothetical protein
MDTTEPHAQHQLVDEPEVTRLVGALEDGSRRAAPRTHVRAYTAPERPQDEVAAFAICICGRGLVRGAREATWHCPAVTTPWGAPGHLRGIEAHLVAPARGRFTTRETDA